MFLTTKRNWEEFDKAFDSLFFNEPFGTKSYQYTNSKLAIEILEDKAVIALSVLGHDKEDISI